MGTAFKLKLLSSDGKSFEKEVDEAYFLTTSGVIGILKDHLPIIAKLEIGIFYYILNNEKQYFSLNGGLLNFKNNLCLVLADTYEIKDEIDVKRARKRKEECLKILNNKDDFTLLEYGKAKLSLKKAENRLKLIDRN